MGILLFSVLFSSASALHQPEGNSLLPGQKLVKDFLSSWTHDGKLIQKKNDELTLLDPETFEEKNYANFILPNSFSSNEKYYYKSKFVRKLYRHSNEELYVIRKTGNRSDTKEYPVGPTGNGNETILLFHWNPNPKANDFVFVHGYNLYYQANPEHPGSAVQVTYDGSAFLRYGVADWLYEEDVFSDFKAVWWSPTGQYISYMRFDDREVNSYIIAKYPNGAGYPEYTEIPYPRPGTPNPVTTLYLWNRENGRTRTLSAPDDLLAMGRDQLPYVFSNTWLNMTEEGHNEEGLLTIWANREQTVVSMTLCYEDHDGFEIRKCLPVLTQKYSMNGIDMWADPEDFKKVIATPRGFFVLLPHEYEDGNIYNHVAYVEIQKGGEGKIIAYHGGPHDVVMIKSYSVEDDMLTYYAPGEEIGSMQLYRVNKASTGQAETVPFSSCIPECGHLESDESQDGRKAKISCYGKQNVQETWIVDIKNPEKRKLVAPETIDKMASSPGEVSFESVMLPSGYDVHVAIAKPPNFDQNKKYPVLLEVYGGPNSNFVDRGKPIFFDACMSCEMIVVRVDGRGSGRRGWKIKAPVYKNLGFYEATDIIDAIKYLSDKYSYMDKDRIAIYGFSYGGYLSTYVATLDQGKTIKCAAAGAPVTDFALYDTAYTERYMGLLANNPRGYNQTNLIKKAAQLANVSFLLAHGEADDNVHYQHSALLSQALQEDNIHFTQLVYTNKGHERSIHLSMEIELFLQKCFNQTSH